jgi:hypothetical protein
MGSLIRPNKVNLEIITKGFFGKAWSEVNIELKRIDENFNNKPVQKKLKTDSKGICNISNLDEGVYLIRASSGNNVTESIAGIIGEKSLEISNPSFLGILPKKKKIKEKNLSELIEFYVNERNRWFCFKCSDLIGGITQNKCSYCQNYFCPQHHLPENHNCDGSPTSIPGSGVRMIHRKGKTEIKY